VLLIVGTFEPLAASRLCAKLVLLPDASHVLLAFCGARHVSPPLALDDP
jgi:hypothetical protein